MSLFSRRLYLVLGLVYIGSLIYMSLTPKPPQGPELPWGDKWMHLLAYGLLMAWYGQLYRGLDKQRLALAFVGLGVALELLQGAGGVRQMELADALANALGVGLGYWVTEGRGGRILS